MLLCVYLLAGLCLGTWLMLEESGDIRVLEILVLLVFTVFWGLVLFLSVCTWLWDRVLYWRPPVVKNAGWRRLMGTVLWRRK